ncbi:hypothetical protein PVK06_045469 [Gossypium arboreum]|uniref:Reverse transcriptase zinc-binding domain-containing protein n=1 Tax=Gossypium arboreum TaxID=29729 RepID=A0ABR0MUM6_GOSAR|nr:hypothetical protein PVK06_045469 [Gossypium arboreum]
MARDVQNESFLLKLGFNLLTNKQALGVKILRAKYKVTYTTIGIGITLCCFVENNILSYITSILSPSPLVGQDELNSNWSANGKFTVKSAYNFLMQNSLNPEDNEWKMAWSFTCLQRVRHFLWLVLKERLLTNVKRCRRGFFGVPSCTICGSLEEYVLQDCGNAREVWKQVIPLRVLL